jgi:hypothetical protein
MSFPEPLYRRTLAEPFQAPIEVVPHIAERLPQPFADLSQFQSLEIEHFQSLPLQGRQILEGTLQLGDIESHLDLVFHIVLAYQSIIQGIDICTRIKSAARQVRLPVPGPAKRDLNDPSFAAAFPRVKQQSFAINIEKCFLHNLFCLAVISENAEGYAEDEPRIPGKKQIQGLGILILKP